MKKNVFRPIDFWKSAVMMMNDNSFFELLRSVFGKIKTPFNKQQLLNDLETFLLRGDIQKTIFAYIDENDAKVIAAAALFGEPVPEELENFFCGELSYAQLQDIIVNLEERFIIYRFTEEKTSRLALNPVLEQILLPFTAGSASLFPAVPKTEAKPASSAPGSSAAGRINDLLTAALLSFVSQWDSFYRSEGVMRKRVTEAGKTIFPGYDLGNVLGSLQIMGLFYADEDKLLPDKKHFDDFAALSARERGEYYAAALLVYSEIKSPNEILPPLHRGKIRDIASFIHSYLESLDEKSLYPEKTLIRMFEILKSQTSFNLTWNSLLENLEKTGLIANASEELKQLGGIAHNKKTKPDKPLITVDTNLSVLVYPEIDFSDAVKLASALNICETSTVFRFELDKISAVRAFDDQIKGDEIIELFKRLAGGKIDDSLVWTIKDWEKSYSEVALKKGIVLSLSEDRRYLIETMPLSEMITETLAPGLYLLNEDSSKEAESALHSAGIDIIARRKEKKPAPLYASSYFYSPSSYSFQEKKTQIKTNAAGKTTGSSKTQDASALTANFHAILNKMPVSGTEKAELAARIDRKLVLCEAQLKDASVRYEKLEARHMDYAGKQNIAKQAITQKSPVEIVWTGAKNDKSIFGVPSALEKEGDDLILVVSLSEKEDLIRIPLAKISLLRRIKKSIFEK